MNNEIEQNLSKFLNTILKNEKNFCDNITSNSNKEGLSKLQILKNFLLSFGSRTATRERLNIFTTNYDRFIEYGLDEAGLLTIDRFIGNLQPVMRFQRIDLDYHYNPPGIRAEPRYVEGVVKFTKIHGSIDWRFDKDKIVKIPLPFGATEEDLKRYHGNTGNPQLFPRVNGFLLIPNESGAIIGSITWIGIEYLPYPKRKGYKDFEIIDLPYPLRKLSLTPLGILKESGDGYEIERGISIFPSVGDIVIIPTKEQLKAIVQNKDENAKVKIGISPLTANAPIFIDPNKLFGRHLAVLGNTGSGKSCTVAGLIRWSLESVKQKIEGDNKINARFIVLDPNGEYGNCFEDLGVVKKYTVKIRDEEAVKQLKVPSWMWSSWEWASIAQASARTQRPLLRRALREVKNAKQTENESNEILFKSFMTSVKISLLNYQKDCAKLSSFPGKQNYGEFLEGIKKSSENEKFSTLSNQNYTNFKEKFIDKLIDILNNHPKNSSGYYPAFSLEDVTNLLNIITTAEQSIGELKPYEGPDEDSPVFFKNEDFLNHLEQLAQETGQQQYLDFFIMRVRSLFTDTRIASVINTQTAEELTLAQWLNDYIGNNADNPSVVIIDLSLLPSEILYLTVAVFARIIFEAHHRYKKKYAIFCPPFL